MSKQLVRRNAILESLQQNSINRNKEIKYILTLDIESTNDFAQSVRIGYYEVHNIETNVIIDKGLYYNILNSSEKQTIEEYAALKKIKLMSMQDFVQKKFYPYILKGVIVIGHNIPFDLGAISNWNAPYGNAGFYLKLCDCTCQPTQVHMKIKERGKSKVQITTVQECKKHPNIIIRKLSSKKYIMFLNSEDENIGAILDTSTIGRAIIGPTSQSLKELGKTFRCDIRKSDFDDYSSVINVEYLDYMIQDVKATLDLFKHEKAEYDKHGLATPLTSILSEASIGKAYFQQLGIVPFRQLHDYLPEWIYTIAMHTYYGARSEVKIRLTPTLISYVDFKSQYPTVNALLHLQELLLAEYISYEHCKDRVIKFVNDITLNELQDKATWQKLRILVKIKPNEDILPCRFDNGKLDNGTLNKGYAVCYVTSPENWYALADIVASKLLTGKSPEIIDAIELIPQGKLETQTIKLFNDDRYDIDLERDDLFTRVIDLRTMVKNERDKYKKETDDYDYYDSIQVGLKLMANSTAYGILVETLLNHGDEYAGKYYAVPIATHITAGARLLLAIAEKLGKDNGLEYAMCDTDSMAYAKPLLMTTDEFYCRVDSIVAWFNPLSPYQDKAAIFELEDVNYYDKKNEHLYFFGISCKRYALYNKLPNNRYRLRKISAHATGRYQFDYQLPLPKQMFTVEIDFQEISVEDEIDEENEDIPTVPNKMKAWQYLIWYTGIEQAEKGLIPTVPNNQEWSQNLARYQETTNTPEKLDRRKILKGIRPFSFFIEYPVRTIIKNGKERKAKYRYVTNFGKTANELLSLPAYRLDNGEIELFPTFETLHDRFKDFFTHPEIKAANGQEIGLLKRRHEIIDSIVERDRTGKILNSDFPNDNINS